MNFHNIEFETSYATSNALPESNHLEIAFAGRSNVGKSSMINKIFNRKNLARVSSMPGKTATINFFKLENIRIVDLPGYGYAKVSKSEKLRWAELMEGYFNSERDIALVLQLVDFRHPPTKDDVAMIEYLIEMEFPFIIILTKADKLSSKQRRERLESFKTEIPCFEHITVIEFSSETGEGVDKIKEIITSISEE